MIVATETYARLKNTATFVKIVGLRVVMKTGTKPSNHAVVFYQPAADANVFLFNQSGSYDLLTRSHDLPELQQAAVERSKAPGSLMPVPKFNPPSGFRMKRHTEGTKSVRIRVIKFVIGFMLAGPQRGVQSKADKRTE